MSTDSEIIRRSIDDPRAFGELYLRHAANVRRYAWRRAGEAVADDVTAETFLLAFRDRERFDSSSHPDALPWFLGIATRLLHGHARAEARRLRAFARSAVTAVTEDPSVRVGVQIDAVAAMTTVAKTLRKMPAADRDCFLLYAQAELTYEQISQAMAIPMGTVRSRIHRARTKLRAATTTDIDKETDNGRTDALPRNA